MLQPGLLVPSHLTVCAQRLRAIGDRYRAVGGECEVDVATCHGNRRACTTPTDESTTLWPFGRKVVEAPGGSGCLSVVFNILWLVLFGWELFLGHLVSGLLLCATIVGIPFGIQAFKLSVLALWPFGQEIVDS